MRTDPHSYADDAQPRADTLDWHAAVDFDSHILSCTATLRFAQPVETTSVVDLDTRDLTIDLIVDEHGKALKFELAAPDVVLGARLRVEVPHGATAISIRYETSPNATALQWLEPEQTAGQRQPFVYTQCQPIHVRSIVPLQDTPTTRLRFTARIDAPTELTVLMAARALGSNAFSMPQPISPYLFAFAIGDLISQDVGPRSRVWAEPSVVDSAAWEFADTDRMLSTGEQLFGPYDWERYDIVVLPPAFPYGGMENPRLTFLTPTVIAGDRSVVGVIAHELAHSWTGNLISNANAEHFWLNEGGATYAERRIVEAMWGRDAAELDWALGRIQLEEAMQRQIDEGRPQLSCLRTRLEGIDPDETYTVVPYEKGALFLRALEEDVGRTTFDGFVHGYIECFRFEALTTEQFVDFLQQRLQSVSVDMSRWLYEPGVPEDAPRAVSARLDAIEALHGRTPAPEQADNWGAVEWQLYIDSIAPPAAQTLLEDVDARYQLTHSGNYDVVERWLVLGIRSSYPPALTRVEEVLGTVGRMKYLRPLYRALVERSDTREFARQLFQRNAAHYHPIARHVVEGIINPVQ